MAALGPNCTFWAKSTITFQQVVLYYNCAERSPWTDQRRSAKLPDLVKKHGSFDKFLADEKVFSYVIPNKDRVNYTTGIVMRDA